MHETKRTNARDGLFTQHMPLDFIEIYPNILNSDTCRRLIGVFESSNSASQSEIINALGGAGAGHAVRRSAGLILSPENCGPLFAQVNQGFQNAFALYRKKYSILERITSVQREAFTLVKYRDNTEEYGWHVDGADPGLRYRFVTGVFYLNTVDIGGETEFKMQERKIKPQEGSVLMFPSGWEYEHRGLPPASGSKYIITAWLRFSDHPPL